MTTDVDAGVEAGRAFETMYEHMKGAEREAMLAHGPFDLFGLFEREDAPGQWDVVVSAPWLTNSLADLRVMTRHITKHLTPAEMLLLARVVPLAPGSEFVRQINEEEAMLFSGLVPVGPITLTVGNLSEATIRSGRIITSRAGLTAARPLTRRG